MMMLMILLMIAVIMLMTGDAYVGEEVREYVWDMMNR